MSTEQSLETQLIEQTKQQIRSLVNEITVLSKSDISPEEFHGEFLPRVISALAAVGGALWTLDENGSLGLAYHVNMREAKLHEDEDANKRHSRLLYRIIRSGEGNLVPAHTVSEGSDEAGNPTEFLLVFGVIKTELETVGLIEILQRSDTNLTTQKGYLRFMEQMSNLASDFYKNRQLRNFGDRQNLWTQLEDFTKTIHMSLDKKVTAFTIANEGRRLIECDRVSVALKRGGKCRIEAVSGQDLLDKRSSTVKLLGKLATAVVRCNEPVWYTGDTSNFAAQVERAVEEYVDESHTKMVAVFPLVRKKLSDADQEYEDHNKRDNPEEPFGALIIEQIEDSRIPERTRKRIEIVADHACSAMGNSIEHYGIFLMPVWRFIGKSKVLVAARMLPKSIVVSLVIAAVILAMFIVPMSFNMHTPGELKRKVETSVYARRDGTVKSGREGLRVAYGDRVYAPRRNDVTGERIPGTLLVELQSAELEMNINEMQGQINATLKEITSIDDMLKGNAALSRADIDRYNGQVEIAKIKYQSHVKQLELLRDQEEDLKIYSPIDGVVMSWDLESKLSNRPVRRGEQLMEIADPNSEWQLELLMPEKRIGHVLAYHAEMLEKDPEFKLKVSFVLASAPEKSHDGTVALINLCSEVRGEAGNTVLVKVKLDDPENLPDDLRLGVSVSAKILCGKKPMGYVLFYQAVEYVQKTVLFWF